MQATSPQLAATTNLQTISSKHDDLCLLCCRQMNHLSSGTLSAALVWQEGPQLLSESGQFGAHLHQAPNLLELLPVKYQMVYLQQAWLLATYYTHTHHLHSSATVKMLKAFTQHSLVITLAHHQPEAECRPHCRPDCSILVCPCMLNSVQAWIKQHHGCQAGSSTVAPATAAECQQQQARHNGGQGSGSATICLPALRILSLCANSLDAVSITELTQGN